MQTDCKLWNATLVQRCFITAILQISYYMCSTCTTSSSQFFVFVDIFVLFSLFQRVTYSSYRVYIIGLFCIIFAIFSFSVPGKEGIAFNEAVSQGKIVIQEASTSTDFEEQESKVLKTRIPSLDLNKERQRPHTIYTVTGREVYTLNQCKLSASLKNCQFDDWTNLNWKWAQRG